MKQEISHRDFQADQAGGRYNSISPHRNSMKDFAPAKRILALVLVISMSFYLLGCSTGKEDESEQQTKVNGQSFTEFIDELWRDNITSDTLSLHYSLAHPENYNITQDKITLGTYSQAEVTDSIKENTACIEQLSAYNYSALSPDDQLVYDCTMAALKLNNKISEFAYYAEPLGPVTGLQAQLPILLAEYHFYDREIGRASCRERVLIQV